MELNEPKLDEKAWMLRMMHKAKLGHDDIDDMLHFYL